MALNDLSVCNAHIDDWWKLHPAAICQLLTRACDVRLSTSLHVTLALLCIVRIPSVLYADPILHAGPGSHTDWDYIRTRICRCHQLLKSSRHEDKSTIGAALPVSRANSSQVQWRIQKFWRGGAEDNLSVPSSFIANAHNGLYASYTEKALLKKNSEPIGGGRPNRSPLWIRNCSSVLIVKNETPRIPRALCMN